MSSKPLLPQHTRYDYIPLPERKDYSWPQGKRLAFTITTNIEWFAFGAGLGHDPAKTGGGGTVGSAGTGFSAGWKYGNWLFNADLSSRRDGVTDDHPSRSTHQTQPERQG